MQPVDEVVTRRYSLESLVARGTSGEVYRGIDRETGEPVAIKRLLPEHVLGSTTSARFAREVRLLAQIDSPYVVKYRAHGPDERGRPCLVLDWVDGEDLSCRLRLGPMPIPEAIEAARQAALGLAALHEAGIVHRDIKPSNFMIEAPVDRLDGDGSASQIRIKLIDLGIARVLWDPALTAQGSTIGTPAYMSPEQARGEGDVTTRSDLFSLGVVLYEMLTGRRPFGGRHPYVVLAKIVLEEPPLLAAIVPGLSTGISKLVACAMAKGREARFESARQMADALAALPPPTSTSLVQSADLVTQELTSQQVSASAEQRVVTAVFALFRQGGDVGTQMRAFADLAAESGAVAHRTLGGRMIAVFGAERSLGDEPVRAARLALSTAQSLNGVRLAIATGRAVAGAAALSGDAIERGARDLEAARSAIRIDSTTARMLGSEFVIEHEDGCSILKGERRSVELSRTLLGKATRCHGRERELGTLDAIWRECIVEPRARAVLLTAPAGGGKSRVRYELVLRIEERSQDAPRDERPLVLFGRGDPLGAGSAFAVIASALRRAAGILDGEPPPRQADKLAALAARHLEGEALDRARVFLGELANVPSSADHAALRAARRDPVLMGDSMRAAWIEFLRAECAAHPVLLVLEDMHWGDLPTIKFVDAALRSLADSPFMVLALARPEIRDRFTDLWAERDLLVLSLGELSAKACTKLVRDVLGDEPSDEIVRYVVERAQGNPFYLEELIRAVAEGQRDDLPDTVLGMVQARLDALGGDARRLLRAASVFGPTFWKGGVQALVGGDASATVVSSVLEELVDREVLTPRPTARFPGETEYAFRHGLLRDAAYAMLLDRDRALAHRLAGQWLERAGETDAIVLAEHFDRGGEPARAVQWYRRGAEQAAEGNDLGGVIHLAERGIALCAERQMLGALHLLRATALRWRGDPVQAERAAVEALELSVPGSAPWFNACREAIVTTGRLAATEDLARHTATATDTTPDQDAEGARVVAVAQGVVSLLVNGKHSDAIALLERLEGVSALDPDAIAQKRRANAFLAYFTGDLGDALVEFEGTIDEFDRIHDLRNACLMRSNLGYLYAEVGQYARAEDVLRRARGTAEKMGLQDIVAGASQNLGYVLSYLGQLAEARQVQEIALKSYEEQRDPRLECASRVYLSMVWYLDGDFAAAEREAAMAVQRAAANDAARVYPLAALARARLAQGRVDEALESARAAAALPDDRYMEGEGLARLVLAEALDRGGNHEGARQAIARAAERLDERARRLGDPVMRRSFLENVPEHARTLELARAWGVRRE